MPGPVWMKTKYPEFKWSPAHTANASIGQGYVLASPLQMAMAYAAVANGGVAYEPFGWIKTVLTPEGKPLLLDDESGQLAVLRPAQGSRRSAAQRGHEGADRRRPPRSVAGGQRCRRHRRQSSRQEYRRCRQDGQRPGHRPRQGGHDRLVLLLRAVRQAARYRDLHDGPGRTSWWRRGRADCPAHSRAGHRHGAGNLQGSRTHRRSLEPAPAIPSPFEKIEALTDYAGVGKYGVIPEATKPAEEEGAGDHGSSIFQLRKWAATERRPTFATGADARGKVNQAHGPQAPKPPDNRNFFQKFFVETKPLCPQPSPASQRPSGQVALARALKALPKTHFHDRTRQKIDRRWRRARPATNLSSTLKSSKRQRGAPRGRHPRGIFHRAGNRPQYRRQHLQGPG